MPYLVKSFRNIYKISTNIYSWSTNKCEIYFVDNNNNREIHESPRGKPDLYFVKS